MKPLILQSDFGLADGAVSAMYGVAEGVCDSLRVYDLTHDIPQYDIWEASYRLIQTVQYWPEGSVFVSVVDPGVGTKRRACVAKLKNGQYIVTPDNGSLTYPKLQVGIEEVREIDETINRYPTTRDVHIFHGRDLFAYCAARLAAGVITFEQVGPAYPVDEVVEAPFIAPAADGSSVSGMITEATEHFGLVGTNIPFKWLAENGMNYGDTVHVTVEYRGEAKVDMDMPLQPSFGYVPEGSELVISSETSEVMVAVNRGNFTTRHGVGHGPDWKLTVSRL